MVDTSFQKKYVNLAIIIGEIDSYRSFLDWWTGAISSCQTAVGLLKSSRYKLLEIIADVTSC